MRSDWLALIISYVYVFAMIGIGEGLRKWRGYSTEFTRKLIHISVGMWAFGTVLLFQHWYFAIIPPLSFVVLNYISYRGEIFKSVETGEKGNLGTVYFPISFAIIICLFWERPNLLVASLMPMTWGDALAAVLGRRYGQRKYSVLGSTRSVEGSLAMFIFSWLSVFLALLLLPPLGGVLSLVLSSVEGLPKGWQASLLYSLAVAVFATLVEALSPWHIDNLTVPLLSAALLYLIHQTFGV
ncbi:MAG: phosphatidate cytidylyltransferase [Anaerolineae bacterium]|nr:phosphatidate cytidylyltransferase [Anaerolineae bacterium]